MDPHVGHGDKPATPPERTFTSLSGEYKVIAPSWVSDEDCLSLVQHLEERGSIPYRSMTRGGGGVSLALGGDGIEVAIDGRPCSVMIFNRTIGVVPVDDDGGGGPGETGELVGDVGPRQKPKGYNG